MLKLTLQSLKCTLQKRALGIKVLQGGVSQGPKLAPLCSLIQINSAMHKPLQGGFIVKYVDNVTLIESGVVNKDYII